jgi:hypothetical protein
MTNPIFLLVAFLASANPQGPLAAKVAAIDLGEVRSGPMLTHYFELRHTGHGDAITFLSASTGCGCVRATVNNPILKPGETAKVAVTVNTLTQPEGPVNWRTVVSYRQGDGPVATLDLKLSGTLVREIGVSPPIVAISTQGALKQTITVTDRRAKPLTVLEAIVTNSVTNPFVSTEVKPAPNATPRVQEITLSVGESLKPGVYDETLILKTDDPSCPELRVPVRVQKRELGVPAVTPESLVIRLTKGQAETSMLAQIRHNGQPVGIQRVESDQAGLTFRWSEGSGPVATVRVLVNPAKAGPAGQAEAIVTLQEPAGAKLTVLVSWYQP